MIRTLNRQMFVYGLLGLLWACQLALRLSTGSDVTVVSDPDILLCQLFSCYCSKLTSSPAAVVDPIPFVRFDRSDWLDAHLASYTGFLCPLPLAYPARTVFRRVYVVQAGPSEPRTQA